MKKILGIVVLGLLCCSPSLSNEKYKNIVEPIFCANDLGAINENTVSIIGNGLYYNCYYNKISHSQAIDLEYNKVYLNEKKNHLNLCFNIKAQKIFKTLNPFTGSCPNYLVKLLYDSNYYFYYGKKLENLDKLNKSYLLVKKGGMNYAEKHEALILNDSEKKKKTSHIVKGISSDGNEYIFDFKLGTIFECIKVPGDWEICDKYKISETTLNGVVAGITYNDFADRLGKKQFGGKKKFYSKYSKKISESKKSCNCDYPIYKKFILDLQTGNTYKVFHPYSKKVKLDDEFRLKYKKNYYKFEEAVSKITIDHIMLAITIYDVVNSGGDILKSSKKSSSSVSSSSTVTKSLGSGSGSVLDKKYGGQSLKRWIAISRR
jgi:hypothetical protein